MPLQGENPPAVVVGLGVNGLGTVRALEREGIPVVAVCSGDGSPAESTRYGNKVICPELQSDENILVETLIQIGRDLPSKSVVFPSGDFSLGAISKNRDRLSDYYYFPFPSSDIIDLVCDKDRFYRFATEHQIPISPTYFPKNESDLRSIAKQINFPALIKPSIATAEWRRRGLKILSATTPEELIERCNFAWEIHDTMVIQEVTPGPDSALHFSLTYLDQQSQVLAMFTGRKIRQNIPRYGISSLSESIWLPKVAELTQTALQTLGYQGYGSIEFKQHPASGEYLMTEITARTWYPHALSTRCGINLPLLAYHDLRGERPKNLPRQFEEHVKWIDEKGDFESASQYRREGELTLSGWLQSYKGKRSWALAAWDDPKPVLVLGREVLSLLMRGTLRRIARLLGIYRQSEKPKT